ncbi:hypothetical protein [Streptomyces europaeiscabiei]|uniref:hypothetical protein n=1 Tax=Streptomyces europaeiscabiei TaxID=146819 RepID=UPI002E13319E|nr:hypothetical protein OHB30_01020 [Streptomyces europaeiscabiei]
MNELAVTIAAAVRRCAARPSAETDEWIRPYAPVGHADRHQFLVMLKPELVLPRGDDGTGPLARVLDLLEDRGVEIGAVRVLSSTFVARHAVVESHYPALNRIARTGEAGMSPAAVERLDATYPGFRAAGGRVVGGFQLLDEVPELTPFALEVLTRNTEVAKLGTGTYAIRASVDGDDLVVLNPFHPQQVAHFTAPGGAVALLECWSELALPTIRRDLIGATDPRDAEPHSIKGTLLREGASLGLDRVSTRRNGVHVSPGAPEGMATIVRYFSAGGAAIRPEDTAFGRRLTEAGLSAEAVAWVAGDPDVVSGEHAGPLFELTEDMDWADALKFVTALDRT